MTDPRIIECAKALKLKAREIGLPVALTADQATDLARACVIKWLEQGPTHRMVADGQDKLSDLDLEFSPHSEAMRGATGAYAAMNACAAKEII